MQFDATSEESVHKLFQTVIAERGGVDGLVNNVGGGIAFKSPRDITLEEWNRANTINMTSMFMASREFIVDPENANYIIPPFTSIDGLGENVADTVVEARKQGAFLSKEDLQRRTALSGTLVKKMESMGVLEGMQDENQMSLFSF